MLTIKKSEVLEQSSRKKKKDQREKPADFKMKLDTCSFERTSATRNSRAVLPSANLTTCNTDAHKRVTPPATHSAEYPGICARFEDKPSAIQQFPLQSAGADEELQT